MPIKAPFFGTAVTQDRYIDVRRARYNNMFRPVEKGILGYIFTPIFDCTLGVLGYLIDTLVHLANTLVSSINYLKCFTLEAGKSRAEINSQSSSTVTELQATRTSLLHAGEAMFTLFINAIYSLLSYFTRPIASIIVRCGCSHEETTREQNLRL